MVQKILIRSLVLFGIAGAVLIFSIEPAFCGGLPASEDITGVEWKWEQTLYGNDHKVVPDDASHYTIRFNPDGILNIRADCNRAGGKYTRNGKSIAIEITHSTMAACPPRSLEGPFLKDLTAGAIIFIKNGDLFLDLKFDSGTMKFRR